MAGLNPLYPAPDKWRPGDNLLDNWYFVGGGSQQGGGQFPINQRGLTEYTEAGYGIDRWRMSKDCNATVTSSGVELLFRIIEAQFWQIVDRTLLQAGSYTFSLLYQADNTFRLYFGADTIITAMDFPASDGPALASVHFNYTPGQVNLATIIQGRVANSKVTPLAAMLEPGPEQHLAHKEGGKWVLNRVPDFREELAKCQAYQVEINLLSDRFAYLGIGMARDEHIAEILVPLTVTLRAKPIISMSGPWQLNDYDSQRTVTDITLETSTLSANILTVNAITTTTKLIIGKTYVLTATSPSARLLLDSNP